MSRSDDVWRMVWKIFKGKMCDRKDFSIFGPQYGGRGFIYVRDGTKIDRTDSRLDIRVGHRVNDLEVLGACVRYAQIPETYWKATAKEMLEKVAGKGPELAVYIAAKYLQGIT